MDEIIRKLVDVVTEPERVELQLYQNAVVKCAKAYNETPSAANAKALEAAQDGLLRTAERLDDKYFNRRPAFKNRMEAYRWLSKEGYKLKKTKFYKDAAEGAVAMQHDGAIWVSDVRAYATTLSKVKDVAGGVEEIHAKKSKEEIARIQLQNEKLRFELDRERGKYELKEDAQQRLVQTLLAFFACLRSRFLTDAVHVLHKVGGTPDKANLLKKLLEGILDDALYEAFAEGEIRVEVNEE